MFKHHQIKKKLGGMLSIAAVGAGLITIGPASPAGAYCKGEGQYNYAMRIIAGNIEVARENSGEICVDRNNKYNGQLRKGNMPGCATTEFNDGDGAGWRVRGINCGVNSFATYTHNDPNVNGSLLSLRWDGFGGSDWTWGY